MRLSCEPTRKYQVSHAMAIFKPEHRRRKSTSKIQYRWDFFQVVTFRQLSESEDCDKAAPRVLYRLYLL
jgi:hypothetical protein